MSPQLASISSSRIRGLAVLAAVSLMGAGLLAGAGIARAQTLDLEYDASTGLLPSASGWTHVVEDPLPDDGLDESDFFVSGGVLTLDDSGGPNADDANRQYYVAPGYGYRSDRDVVEIEFRLRIAPGSTWRPLPDPNPKAGFGVDVVDLDGDRFLLWIGPDGLFVWAGGQKALHLFDATASMMDYALRVDASGVSVSLNGAVVGFVPRADFGLSSPAQLRFGDLTDTARGGFDLEAVRVWRSDPVGAEVRRYEPLTAVRVAAPGHSGLTETVTCPVGKLALGGGARVDGADGLTILTESRPAGGSPPTGWTASAETTASAPGWSLTVHVICGEMSDPTEYSLVEDQVSTVDGLTTLGCGGNGAPISGGAAIGSISYSGQPALTGIGLNASGHLSQARAYDREYSGVLEGVDWELASSVVCVETTDQVVVTRTIPQGSHGTATPKGLVVTCPNDFLVVGGGARVVGVSQSAVLSGSHPIPGSRAWQAVGHDLELLAEHQVPWDLEVTAVCAPLAEPMLPRVGLVSRWNADLGDGRDAVGSNDAMLANGASVEAGLDDQAFRLERVGEEHLAIDGLDFYPQGSFTVDAWIETDSLAPGDSTDIVSLFDAGGPEPSANTSWWAIHLSQEGEARGRVRAAYSNPTAVVAQGSGSLADGRPHHLAMVRDLDNGHDLRLYVDGVEVDSQPLGPAALPLYPGNGWANPDPVTIGAMRDSFSTNLVREFEGLIDDVKYWDRALDAEEIERLAGCGVPILPRVVNLTASRFGGPAGTDHDLHYCVWLDAGTYSVELVNPATADGATYTAWSADDDVAGEWRTDFVVEPEIDPGLAGGSSTPRPSAQDAFDLTSPVAWPLTLSSPQRVYLGVRDGAVLDNRGGVSLRIDVPEPATGWMLGAGGVMLAWISSRRRRAEGGS